MGCCSNGSSYPFRKNRQPFEPFELSVQKNCQPFERLELSVQKKLPAVRTARAIRSEKIVSRSNGSGYPFRKNCQPFERIELSVQKKRATVRASAIRSAARVEQLCEINIRRYVALRMKICVVYKHLRNIIITVLFLLLSYLSIIDKRFIQDLSFIQSSWL